MVHCFLLWINKSTGSFRSLCYWSMSSARRWASRNSVQKKNISVIRICLWKVILSQHMFWWDIRFHLKINNIFIQDSPSKFACNWHWIHLQYITSAFKYRHYQRALNGSGEFGETECFRLSVTHLRNRTEENKKVYVAILYSCYL